MRTCFLCLILEAGWYNPRRNKTLRSVLSFGDSDLSRQGSLGGFRISDLVFRILTATRGRVEVYRLSHGEKGAGPHRHKVLETPPITWSLPVPWGCASAALWPAVNYAKQTQFPKSQNEPKSRYRKVLRKKYRLPPAEKQTQSNPTCPGEARQWWDEAGSNPIFKRRKNRATNNANK